MPKCILVVDDDEMNLTRTRIILKKKDYDVLLANSGMEALQILKHKQVDLVLLDIEMPKMNGFVTFKRIKETVGEIPVIFFYGFGPGGERKRTRMKARHQD